MKRDFSQKFNTSNVRYELIIQHAITKKFLLFKSTEEYEEDWYRTRTFEAPDTQELTQVLAKYLYDNQLLLVSHRELARQTNVAFSFIDKAPGSETTGVCLLVVVDIPAEAKLGTENEQTVYANLDDLLSRFPSSPEIDSLSYLGVAHLKAEARELGQV